jgi:hypothetical protein
MDATLVGDERAVFRALDRATKRSKHLRELAEATLIKQRALRRTLPGRQWQEIVAWSNLLNTQHYEILNLAIRIALRRGRRSRKE